MQLHALWPARVVLTHHGIAGYRESSLGSPDVVSSSHPLRMQAQAPQPSQPAYPAHLRAQPMEGGKASTPVEDGLAASAAGPASTGMEVLLEEAQARLLAAELESIDLGAGLDNGPQNGKVHASTARMPSPQQAQQQRAAATEGSTALNGAVDRHLTFKGIVFDLETTGQQLVHNIVLWRALL